MTFSRSIRRAKLILFFTFTFVFFTFRSIDRQFVLIVRYICDSYVYSIFTVSHSNNRHRIPSCDILHYPRPIKSRTLSARDAKIDKPLSHARAVEKRTALFRRSFSSSFVKPVATTKNKNPIRTPLIRSMFERVDNITACEAKYIR